MGGKWRKLFLLFPLFFRKSVFFYRQFSILLFWVKSNQFWPWLSPFEKTKKIPFYDFTYVRVVGSSKTHKYWYKTFDFFARQWRRERREGKAGESIASVTRNVRLAGITTTTTTTRTRAPDDDGVLVWPTKTTISKMYIYSFYFRYDEP